MKKEKKTTLNHMNISQKITLIDNKCVKRYKEWLQQLHTYIIISSYIIKITQTSQIINHHDLT